MIVCIMMLITQNVRPRKRFYNYSTYRAGKVWNMFKVNIKDTRTMPSGVFIVNFERIPHLALMFLLLTLKM